MIARYRRFNMEVGEREEEEAEAGNLGWKGRGLAGVGDVCGCRLEF